MEFCIVVSYLDPDEEQDEVLACFEKDGIIPSCDFENASNGSNAISILICTNDDTTVLHSTLSKISSNTLKLISDYDLDIALCIGIPRVNKRTKLPSGLIESFSKHASISHEVLKILSEKEIDLEVVAYDWNSDHTA